MQGLGKHNLSSKHEGAMYDCRPCLQRLIQQAHNVLDDAGIPYDSDGDEMFSLPKRIAELAERKGVSCCG